MNLTTLNNLKNREHFVVTQSNTLIEAEYSTELTARAHKTARLILSLISPDDKNLRLHTIPVNTVKKYLGMNPNSRWGAFNKELEDIAERLREKPIRIKEANGDKINAVFLSAFKISPKQGTVTFEISELLKPYLLELKKNYTSYLLTHIPKLRSSYSIRLYELLHQYRRIGKRYFELDDLQRKVGSNYQNKYNNFKRKVLLQAQKDLKKHTDLAFAFSEKKEGRKITGIEFIIFGNKPESKEPNQLSFLDDNFEDKQESPALSEEIIKAMNALGISEQNIAKYLAMGFDIINREQTEKDDIINRCQTLQNYYLEKLELTKHSADRDNAAGFFIKALKEDWTSSKALQKTKAIAKLKERKAAEKELSKMTAQIEQLSKQKKNIQIPIIEELLSDDTILNTAYDAVMKKMSGFTKRTVSNVLHLPVKEQYEKSMSISSSMRIYLFENYSNRFKQTNAIDTQIEQIQKSIQEIRKKYPAIK